MSKANTPTIGVSDVAIPEPIRRHMRTTNALLTAVLTVGAVLSIFSVATWNPVLCLASAAVIAALGLWSVLRLRHIRDEQLPFEEHTPHENRLLTAVMFSVFFTTLLWISALIAAGVSQVWANILGVLPAFTFYMYLIFGVTRHGEETVYDWFIKQPKQIVDAGMAPIKAAGDAQRTKDSQGDK